MILCKINAGYEKAGPEALPISAEIEYGTPRNKCLEAMVDLYALVRDSLNYKKYMINDLICVEYACPVEEEHVGIYAECDYLIHILIREALEQEFPVVAPAERDLFQQFTAARLNHEDYLQDFVQSVLP